MHSRRIYPAVAASLAVSLGFGLIYLYAVGRIGAFTAIAAVLAMGFLMIVLAALADVTAEDRRRSRSPVRFHRP